jgi:hypothetical protein
MRLKFVIPILALFITLSADENLPYPYCVADLQPFEMPWKREPPRERFRSHEHEPYLAELIEKFQRK